MKKLTLLLAILFLSATAQATITVTRIGTANTTTAGNTNCGGNSSCYQITITSTVAGRALVALVVGSAGQFLTTCYDGGDTFTTVAAASGSDSSGGTTGICYNLSVTAGHTVFYVLGSDSFNPAVTVYSMSWTATSLAYDNAGNADRTVACTGGANCAGMAPSLTGSNDVIFQVASCGGACSAITTYTGTFTSGDGFAYLNNSTSTTAPTWTQSPSETLAVAYVAFKEVSAGGSVAPGKAVIF